MYSSKCNFRHTIESLRITVKICVSKALFKHHSNSFKKILFYFLFAKIFCFWDFRQVFLLNWCVFLYFPIYFYEFKSEPLYIHNVNNKKFTNNFLQSVLIFNDFWIFFAIHCCFPFHVSKLSFSLWLFFSLI